MSVVLRRVLFIVLFLVGLAGVVYAFSEVNTGDPDDDVTVTDARPYERLLPSENAEILRQETFGIDLKADWTGVLVVNGTEIPQDELDELSVPELNQVLYRAGPGLTVERLEAGTNCVTAVVWRVSETRANSRDIRWCFNAT